LETGNSETETGIDGYGHNGIQQPTYAEIAARADQQHAWVMAGDERGMYGQFPPAAL
jgi:hypothetical protein